MELSAQKYVCAHPTCPNKHLNDHFMTKCQKCKQWFHRNCANLTINQIHVMKLEEDRTGRGWYCATCAGQVGSTAEPSVTPEVTTPTGGNSEEAIEEAYGALLKETLKAMEQDGEYKDTVAEPNAGCAPTVAPKYSPVPDSAKICLKCLHLIQSDYFRIQCDKCNWWYHKDCANITATDIHVYQLEKHLPHRKKWYCVVCLGQAEKTVDASKNSDTEAPPNTPTEPDLAEANNHLVQGIQNLTYLIKVQENYFENVVEDFKAKYSSLNIKTLILENKVVFLEQELSSLKPHKTEEPSKSGTKSDEDSKAWLFVSKFPKCVDDNFLKRYIKRKAKIANDEDIIVKHIPTITEEIRGGSRSFQVGIKGKYLPMVYSEYFWPQKVVCKRFEFGKKKFID